jgi:hypothetical protein
MNTFDICIHLLNDLIYFRESYMHVVYVANWCIPIVLYEFIWWVYSFVVQTHILSEFIYACRTGTNNQKKELFVMAVCSPSGKTFPGNVTIIPSAKKWVFHAIYCLAILSLYGKHICLLNQLVITDEEDAEYRSFETLILTHEVFRSSTVMLCTFHAIWQPFKRDIYNLLPSKKSQNGKLMNLLRLVEHGVSIRGIQLYL